MIGGPRSGYCDVRTIAEDNDAPRFLDVKNVLQAAVPQGEVSLPMTVTVTERSVELPVDEEEVDFLALETASSWRLKAYLHGRILEAAGLGVLPPGVAFSTVRDVQTLPRARFG